MSDSDEFEYDYDDAGASSDDGGYDAMEETETGLQATRSKEAAAREFRVLKQEDLMNEQNKVIQDVSNLLDVPLSCAGIMLRYFR